MQSMGIFTVSIDYESAWGFADSDLSKTERKRINGEVDVTKRLIELFKRYKVPVTWAVVGHLLEKRCNWSEGHPHPEYRRPIHENEKRDWFFHHPAEGEYNDPLWFDSNGLIQIGRASCRERV